MAAVGQAITNLMLTSSILSEYIEFLHRTNSFKFKACEYCTPTEHENGLLSYQEIADKFLTSCEGEDLLQTDCRRSRGNHFVITYCQKLSLINIAADHSEPGYMKPHDIPHKGFNLEQITMGYSGASLGHRKFEKRGSLNQSESDISSSKSSLKSSMKPKALKGTPFNGKNYFPNKP
jgi:hypothetical protein